MADEPRTLRIRLFGPFAAWWRGPDELDLRGAKAKALLALLATAPDARRTRAFLQNTLWGLSGPMHGRASLRQSLSAFRRLLGEDFDDIFVTTNETVGLRHGCVVLVGSAADGPLLEGLEIPEPGFVEWLKASRSQPPAPAIPRPVAVPAAERSLAVVGDLDRATSAGAFADRIAPVIAVIPFVGMEHPGVGLHLGDALAQDITRCLSRSPYLRVISHLSSRDRRLRNADLTDVRMLLDADYVVAGHVRVDGDRFRLDVDFVDVASGELRWTRDFTGSIARFFVGDEAAVQAVADATFRAVVKEALSPIGVVPLPDIASHRLLMAGITQMHRISLGSFAWARRYIEEVISRAPRHAILYAWLAKWYVLSIQQGWSVDFAADSAQARDHAARALDLDPGCSFSLAICGVVHHHLWQLDAAFALHEEALAIDPNNALAWLLKGALHTFRDEGETAVAHTERALTLSPLDPHRYLFDALAAGAHAVNGNYERALDLANNSLRANRRHASTIRVKTFALEMLGRHEEAEGSVGDLLRIDPQFTVRKYLSTHPSAMFGSGRQWAEVFQRAGVPAQ